MKKECYIFILLLLSIVIQLEAQISLTSDQFPADNDVLILAVDNLPNVSIIPEAGENRSWQLGNLQAPFARRMTFENAANGLGYSFFREADLMANIAEGVEAYYKINNAAFIFLGTYGEDPFNLGFKVPLKYENGLVDRIAPLNYGDTFESTGSVFYAFDAEDLPQAILDQLPIVPDSLRIRMQTSRNSVIDGWGTLLIPGGSYDVLRENRTEVTSLRLDAKVGFLPWIDVTEFIPQSDQLRDVALKSFHFLNNTVKEPIAVVYATADGDRIARVEFKGDALVTNIGFNKVLKPGVYAYPNPAIANVRFEFKNLTPGNYRVAIYDILANEVWSKSYQINGDVTKMVDISNITRGTYIYRLTNEKGEHLSTRRIIILSI